MTKKLIRMKKKFHEAIIEFNKEIVKYVKENAGRILTEDECVRFYRTRRDLTPKDIKESIFLTPASAQRMENNEYSAKLYFNESSENAALEKFYEGATITFGSNSIDVTFAQNVSALKGGVVYRWFAWNAMPSSMSE